MIKYNIYQKHRNLHSKMSTTILNKGVGYLQQIIFIIIILGIN